MIPVGMCSEEAESATELMPDETTGSGRVGSDALNVRGNKISKSIRTFADAYVAIDVLPVDITYLIPVQSSI